MAPPLPHVKHPHRTVAVTLLFLLAIASTLSAQTSPPNQRQPQALAAYEGGYVYRGNASLVLVAAETLLFAVIDEAKYPLRSLGNDRFLNAAGDTIPFRRGSNGVITGFVERGVFFARHTQLVDPAIAAAVRAVARPVDSSGRPARYVYVLPDDVGDGLRVGDAPQAGLDTAVVSRIVRRVADGTYPDVHAILVHRGERLIVEEYFYGYDRDRPHQMRSATKSIVGALVGLAIDRRALAADIELVSSHLASTDYANANPGKDRLTLRDLLTMRSGLACDDWDAKSLGNESRVYQAADWVKYVLDLPMLDPPGTRARYCSGNVLVAGRIVERATGMALLTFAQQHLFTPLGIRSDDVRWNFRLTASNGSFAQLYMRPRDMLKLGILFHQNGSWNDGQVLSREWVAQSTAKWSTVGDQEYGYFWWHQWVNAETSAGPRRVDMIVATGNGGQKIYLVPSLDLVVVMTGGNYNASSPATAIMARELLPALLSQGGPAR